MATGFMRDQASVRSTARISWSNQKNADLNANKSVWSNIRTLEMKKRFGKVDHVRYKIEVYQVSTSNEGICIRLHWLQGDDFAAYWRFRHSEFPFSEVDKVENLGPGSVMEHKEEARYGKVCYYIEAQLDIMTDVEQNGSSSQPSGLDNGFVRDFGNMLTTSDMSDVVLTCGSRQFPCHRLVLACRSKVFKAMLFSSGDFTEKEDGGVVIDDFPPEVVEQFLKFVYGDECDLKEVDPWDVLAMADKYDIETLTAFCVKVCLQCR